MSKQEVRNPKIDATLAKLAYHAGLVIKSKAYAEAAGPGTLQRKKMTARAKLNRIKCRQDMAKLKGML